MNTNGTSWARAHGAAARAAAARPRFAVARAAAVVLAAAAVLAVAPGAKAAASYVGGVDAPKPRGLAVDAARERLYVAEQDGNLAVVDTRAIAVVARVPLTCCLADVAVDRVREKVWVAGNGLLVVDQASNELERTIPVVPGAADAVAVSEPLGRVFVALPNEDTIAVADAVTQSVVARWASGGDRPEALAVDGSVLVVANQTDGAVVALDASSGAVLRTASVAAPVALAVNVAGREVFVATAAGPVVVLDADTFATKRSLWTGGTPGGIAFNPANGRLWVPDAATTTTIMMRSHDGVVLGRIPMGVSPSAAAFDPRFARTYVGAFGSGRVVALGEGPGLVEIQLPFAGGFLGPTTMRMSGKAPPGSPVTVYEDGVQVAFTYADISSNWTTPVTLAEGSHTVVATVPEEAPSPPRTFTVDLSRPVLTQTFRTPPNAAGWNNGLVHVRWSCTDAASGVDPAKAVVDGFLVADGRNQSVPASCTDRVGNIGTTSATGIHIDRTPPTVGLAHVPSPNSAGWNRTLPVSVAMTCFDALSGLADDRPVSRVFTAETAGDEVVTSCSDVAGNTRGRSVIVRVDTRAPIATLDADVPVAAPGLPLSGEATDSLSGPSSVEVRLVSADGLEQVHRATCSSACESASMRWRLEMPGALAPGVYAVSARAVDVAGNVGGWSAAAQMLLLPGVNPRDPPRP